MILREMRTKPGDLFNYQTFEDDRKRVQSLGIFSRVETIAEPAEGGTRLIILVSEGWTLLPYPILEIEERDWKKISYGAGLRCLNFRGRAETVDILFKAGYSSIYRMTYANPWIGGSPRLLAALDVYYQKVPSRHFEKENVHENRLAIFGRLGNRFTMSTSAFALLGYRQVSLSPSRIGSTLYPKDHLPVLGVSFEWDRRDLKEYPRKGFFLSVSARKTGWPSLRADYESLDEDARWFFPLSRVFTLAVRNASTLTSGAVPLYDRLYLGYEERIRGHWVDKAEGENRWLSRIALRFPLIPVRYFDLGEDSKTPNLKFGLSFSFFADAGAVWVRGESLRSEKMILGYGAGLHFHMPIVDVLRLEAAFNEKGRQEWILDLGVDI